MSDYRPAAFNLTTKQLSELKVVSHRTGIPQSQLVREAIDTLLEKYNAAPAPEPSAG